MKKLISCFVLSLACIASVAAAPELPALSAAAQAGNQVALKVQVVVSRFQGEKKVSSVPYTLAVIANDGDKTSLRMGVDVPVPQTVFQPSKAGETVSAPITSYNYRSVGTNIDCTAKSTEVGVFKLDMAVSDTSVFLTPRDGAVTAAAGNGLPAFRSFTSSFHMLLKDGQTAQHTTATDAVSGEVLKLDVTLTVLK
ncbi:MAG: hypothetical protein ABIS06_08930 [Vicinamibacterales bacterium]